MKVRYRLPLMIVRRISLHCTPVNLFQLARPDKEQFRIPNFDIILDTFCRYYATSLTNQLQRTFSVTRVSLETFEFQKFMADKSKPGSIGILDLPPLKQGALIIFDPKLSFSMLEIMLGASSDIESLELDRKPHHHRTQYTKGIDGRCLFRY